MLRILVIGGRKRFFGAQKYIHKTKKQAKKIQTIYTANTHTHLHKHRRCVCVWVYIAVNLQQTPVINAPALAVGIRYDLCYTRVSLPSSAP